MQYIDYDVLSIRTKKFSDLDLDNPFFDTLKNDYPGFENWFIRKGNENAFVVNDGGIQAFLYMKLEDKAEDYSIFEKPLPSELHLKIGTFKITKSGYYLGERFFRIILEHALLNDVDDIYVTIFPKREEQKKLIGFMETFGFSQYTKNRKTNELVFMRKMNVVQDMEPSLKNYPYVNKNLTRNYFMLAIDAGYHTKLIPDSILRGEDPSLITSDINAANAVKKTYIGNYRIFPTPGDIIVYYRNKPVGQNGSAKYLAIVTGFGMVSETFNSIRTYAEVSKIVSHRSVLTTEEIKTKLRTHSSYGVNILKFFDLFSFKRRPIRNDLIENDILVPTGGTTSFGGIAYEYPTKKITKEQFDLILELANFNENLFI
ncbi:hypothetical protein NIE88_05145 [Sporolactobacillus shoreicorticis]|uniref:N-acetyltransferase domain-containing protein n=1 Tax=Sporolactobacillus shoreicorticis TaxID=1923877 RepID=A0ABW5RYF2_9BACL|nr:hypothetical protein [Sporolactobacillus shoreicorticis]MCO7125159.1 hypothetical protein [Sporolactobacillus shoreicorticis]